MITDTEALREQFEQYVNPDGDVNLRWLAAGFYAVTGVQESWLDFKAGYQAGHAAAKAETAAAVERERERCASVADKHARIGVLRSLEATYKANAAKVIANAIRAGAKEPSDG